MKLTTKTEYGLICLKYLLEHSCGKPISVAEIATKERIQKDYIEQIFSKLRKSDIVASVQGLRGGFVLSRDPSQITLKQIVEALEGDIFEVFCSPRIRERIVCEHFSRCSVRPIWDKLEKLIDEFCESITLDLLREDEPVLEKHLELLPAESAPQELSRSYGTKFINGVGAPS